MQFMPDQAIPRRVVASYESYAEAQAAVDALSDQRFPVERLSIVGSDLRIVEQITGRLNWGRAALAGAASGAPTGGLFGLIFALFLTDDPGVSALGVFLYGVVIGALIGAALSIAGYAVTGGRRDFSSVGGLQANRYDVMADQDVADEAERLLRELPRMAGGVRRTELS